MNNVKKIFDPSNYPDIPAKKCFAYSYNPPGMVRVRGNVESDTFLLDSAENRWDIWYGGVRLLIDWNHEDFSGIDDSLIALWRHHLTEAMQKLSPCTIFCKYQSFRGFAGELTLDLSIVTLLRLFSLLYSNGVGAGSNLTRDTGLKLTRR